MAERTGSPASPRDKENRDFLISAPSPFERAFDQEIKTRFGSKLLKPYLDDHGSLIRLASPVSVMGATLVFQYTRFNIGLIDPVLVQAMLKLINPEDNDDQINTETGGLQLDDESEALTRADYKQRRMAVDYINRRLRKSGGYDPKKAVTNPRYYIPKARITQWPETFRVAIFQNGNQPFQDEPKPTELGNHGKINSIRPDYLGTLSLGVVFKGIEQQFYRSDGDNTFRLTRPKAHFEAVSAFESAFYPPDASWSVPGNNGIEIDDMPLTPKWYVELPVYSNGISGTPKDVMGKIGALASNLAE